MSFQAKARKLVEQQARSADRFFLEQNRRLSASGEFRTVSAVETNSRGVEITYSHAVQESIVTDPVIHDNTGTSIIDRSYETVPKPRQVLEPTPGSPLDLTIGEIERMSSDERAVTLRRIMAVDGARERMAPIPGRTLTQALIAELDFQRTMIREANRVVHEGKTSRVGKGEAKRANKQGAHKLRSGGKANFRRSPVINIDVTIANPWRGINETTATSRQRARRELGVLEFNAMSEE